MKAISSKRTETLLVVLAILGIALGYALTLRDELSQQAFLPPVKPGDEEDWRIQDETNTIDVFEFAREGVVMVSVQRSAGSDGLELSTKGNGSGFFVNDQGYLVTNYHVVRDASVISVHTYWGRSYTATVVGGDRLTDLALLRVSIPDYEVTPLSFADPHGVRVGQKAIVVGSPLATGSSLGLDRSPTVTSGIVSAKDRSLPVESLTRPGVNDYTIENLIQTDAAVNPGNSGGPLLNSSGEVVGVVTAIIDSANGIGFAIPSEVVLEVITQIMQTGEVKRAFMGVAYQPLDEIAEALGEDYAELGLPTKEGALVSDVDSLGPAEKAGIKGGQQKVTVAGQDVVLGGDIIVAIGDVKVLGSNLSQEILKYKPGDKVQVQIIRNRMKLSVEVALGLR